MSKNIKAYFNEENESITIESDAKAGDQIQLSNLTSFDKYIDKEIKTKYRTKIINEFKDSEEYKSYQLELESKKETINALQLSNQELKNKVNSFEDKIKILRNETIEEFKNSNTYKELINSKEQINEENIKLKEQLNSNKKIFASEAIEEFRKSEEFLSKIKLLEDTQKVNSELKEEILKLNNKLNIIEQDNEIKELKKEAEFNLEITKKEKEIDSLKKEIENINKRKREMNIKQLGEDFEQECLKMYNESLGQIVDDSIFKKAELIDGNKADFVFEVYAKNTNEKQDNPLLGKTILEMKTEQNDSIYKKSNKYYLEKLEKDRTNSNANIALLITELEREDNFYIKRDPDYKNIIIARPEAMIPLLTIIRILFLKNKDIVLKELEFKDKQLILDEFNQFKDSVLNTTLKNINNNITTVKSSAEKISKEADNILKAIDVILNTHINSFKNKFENFNIEKKVINKIK